jgi:uncharacterized SAM-binding protein YcdF (DUF218 family)
MDSTHRIRDFFVRRREVWQLTWRARLLLLGLIAGACVALARGIGGFLAVNEPIGARYLVVEGWMPQFAYEYAATLNRQHHYRRVIAVGATPDFALSNGTPREFAAVGSLVAAGIPESSIVQAMGGQVHQDRTYHSALNVKKWLASQSIESVSVDVLTLGPHARRSRLLFEKALGPKARVGVISIPDPRFDLAHWWRSSEGVRSVLGETIAYVYARLFFDPSDLG